MVSLGYSVVKPSLGMQVPRVAGLGMAYFVLAMSYDLLVSLPRNNMHLGQPAYMDSLTVLVLLLALVDIAFYMWILQALLATISDLEKKGQAVKLLLFRRFRNVLAMSVLFSLVWSTYSMAASLEGYYEEHWKSRWSLTAVWEVFYVVILMVIALLWMPSKNSQRYAYSIQLATSDPDDGREEDGIGGGEEDSDLVAEYGGGLVDTDSTDA